MSDFWQPHALEPARSSVHGILQARTENGLPCPPPGDLSNPGKELLSLMSPALAGRFFTTSATWEALTGQCIIKIYICYYTTHLCFDTCFNKHRAAFIILYFSLSIDTYIVFIINHYFDYFETGHLASLGYQMHPHQNIK